MVLKNLLFVILVGLLSSGAFSLSATQKERALNPVSLRKALLIVQHTQQFIKATQVDESLHETNDFLTPERIALINSLAVDLGKNLLIGKTPEDRVVLATMSIADCEKELKDAVIELITRFDLRVLPDETKTVLMKLHYRLLYNFRMYNGIACSVVRHSGFNIFLDGSHSPSEHILLPPDRALARTYANTYFAFLQTMSAC
jgi:hypothetical protein